MPNTNTATSQLSQHLGTHAHLKHGTRTWLDGFSWEFKVRKSSSAVPSTQQELKQQNPKNKNKK